jgi:uncharacterized membrane protein YhaH (DUF805 family)
MSAEVRTEHPDAVSPGVVGMLFGVRGRIGRGRYWIGVAVVVALLFVAMVFVATAMNPTGGGGGVLFGLVVICTALWVHAAVTIKRLRDMGQSAWLYAGLVAVLIASLYVGVEAAEATRGLSLGLTVVVLAVPGMVAGKPGVGLSPR